MVSAILLTAEVQQAALTLVSQLQVIHRSLLIYGLLLQGLLVLCSNASKANRAGEVPRVTQWQLCILQSSSQVSAFTKGQLCR